MGIYIGSRTALLRALLLVTTALVLQPGAVAAAPVGVTSAADGDPLGRPPNENERILRIGIDVQANELITTQANDRAHLVFLDGSSLTVGPNARLAIDKFVYDPNTQKGELAVNASKGVFRLVGGKISKSNPITITTPSSTIGIRGGITIVTVTERQTIADFIHGVSMTVFGGGVTQVATRPGSQIISIFGKPTGAPTLLPKGSLNGALSQLEGKNANNNNGPDQTAQSSGFSGKNSGQPPNVQNVTQNLPPNTTNNILTNALSNSNGASNPAGNSTPQTQIVTNPNNPPPPPPPPASQTFTGFTSGIAFIQQGGSGGGDPRSRSTLPVAGQVSITTDPANQQAKGTIVIPFQGSQSSSQQAIATLQLGGVGGLGANNSSFTNNQTYSMVTQTNDPSRPSTLQAGSQTIPLPNSTFLASPAAFPARAQLGACRCEFLTWGSWLSTASDPRPGQDTTVAVIGNYVAGTPTTAVQLPMTGSATYKGFMAGVVDNNGRGYAAGGNLQLDWNFQNRAGNFNGSFDGRNYAGSMSASGAGPNFSGNISGGDRSGAANGAFFRSPTDAAKYVGGSFAVGGNNYKASGVFAGQR